VVTPSELPENIFDVGEKVMLELTTEWLYIKVNTLLLTVKPPVTPYTEKVLVPLPNPEEVAVIQGVVEGPQLYKNPDTFM
jgi:hypothetical protein